MDDSKQLSDIKDLLFKTMCFIESETIPWRVTSYMKNRQDSLKHTRGLALDFAPEIPIAEKPLYARYKMSDPVLNQRITLIKGIRKGITKANKDPVILEASRKASCYVDVYLESDHIHIEVRPYRFVSKPRPLIAFRVWLFDRAGVYADSRQRHVDATNGALPFPTFAELIKNRSN